MSDLPRPTVLRGNASSVYAFLTQIAAHLRKGELLDGLRILDCGAAGAVPPLSIFAEQKMDCVGIDISEERIEQSRAFAAKRNLAIEFVLGDMRSLPFEDGSFDHVYEHNSICHLGHADTARAISEMRRVLKPGGVAQFEIVSRSCWPLSSFGEERGRGEFWMSFGENASDEACHSLFADDEIEPLLAPWKILSKVNSLSHRRGDYLSEKDWAELHAEAPMSCTPDEWMAVYPRRMDLLKYITWTFLVEKPA